MKTVNFTNYPKGNSKLGSLIETLVKQVKHLIFKSIRNLVLNYPDFELLIDKATSLINKRPTGFKDGLRALPPESVPDPITPEMMLLGYDAPSVTVIPQILLRSTDEDPSPDYMENVSDDYDKVRKARERLIDHYHSEFLSTLTHQAVNEKNRFKTTPHQRLNPGDIVLLVEKMQKRYNYPMGRIQSVEYNELDESTAAKVLRGDTREIVFRHATSLILLIPHAGNLDNIKVPEQSPQVQKSNRRRSKRNAALKSRSKTKEMLNQNS